MSGTEPAADQEKIERMLLRLREYEHRFAMLDTQMRVLERERQKLSAVVNNTDAGFLVLDSSLRLVWTNQQAPGLLRPGPHPGAILGQLCNQVVCGRDSLCDFCPASQAFLTGQVAHREIRVEIDGLPHEIYATSMPIKEPDGRIEQTIIMLQDVSGLQVLREEKAGVQLLQEVAVAANEAESIEQAMRICLDRICEFTGWPIGHVFILADDGSGDLVSAGLWHVDDAVRHAAFREITSRTRSSVGVGLPGRILASGLPAWIADVTQDDNFPRASVTNLSVRAGFGFPVKVGREVVAVMEFFSADVIDPEERLLVLMGHIGTQLGRVVERQRARDALCRSEEQLRHAQKMEAIGRLAGGIAHDFNNLLTVITGYSEIMSRELSPGHPFCEPVGEIRKAGDRAASLTKQLLAFSRKQVLQPRVLDLNLIVTGIERMLRPLVGETVHLATSLHEGLGHVKADPGQIEQVIMNLTVNASDAMPAGGQITIETHQMHLTGMRDAQQTMIEPGQYVILTVADTGGGMDAETLQRIFEPFFTTKDVGRGTGLGLSMVYGIVRQSGGYIFVESEPGHGTRFRICLPLVEEPLTHTTARPDSSIARNGDETVLLVEDEVVVRSLVREVLEQGGYQVLEAKDPADARLICERYKGRIDLMLTDVVMPMMSGFELAEYLGPIRPGMRVLYMSGYTDEALDPSAAFLQKPFTPDRLAGKVRELLDTAAGPNAQGS